MSDRYRAALYASRGDPFIGALVGGLGTLARTAIGFLGGRAAAGAAQAAGRAASQAIVQQGVRRGAARMLPTVAAGATGPLAARVTQAARAVLGSGAVRTVGTGVAIATGAQAAGRVLEAGTRFVTGAGQRRRYRRMNPLNLRALTRADRRLTKFAGIARRYVARCAPQRRVRAFGKRRRKS